MLNSLFNVKQVEEVGFASGLCDAKAYVLCDTMLLKK